MNRIVLVGRLESTPELRHTSTGIPVANFSLSVRRNIPNGQGRYERDVFRVVTWRKLAETCCRFLERGRMIAVDGKLQNRVLQSPNGDRRVIVEIHADDVRFLEGARPRNGSDQDEEFDMGIQGDNGHEEHVDQPEDEQPHESVQEPAPELEKPEEIQAVPTPEPEIVAVTSNTSEYEPSDNSWFKEEDDGTPL
jgi:single-strand DNA-binding protein